MFLFAAYLRTTVAVASLCNYMSPVFVIILTPFVLREKLDLRKLPCITAAFIGIILVSGVIGGEIGDPSGILSGLLAAFCFTGMVFCNRKLKDIDALDRSFAQLAVSAVTILIYILVRRISVPVPDLRSALIVLMLGVVHTGLAYIFYFGGMAVLPIQTVAVFGYLEPVVSVFCSAFFLHEAMGLPGWIGAVLVIAAAVVSDLIPDRT